jgi:hypothetical protein
VTRRSLLLLPLAWIGPSRPAAADAIDVPIQALDRGLWWVPAAAGDGNAQDRGRVSNLLIAVQANQGWLIGSGPSPAFGRALRAALDARWPRRHWTVVSAWPHPEAVLGVAGLGTVVHAGHAEVAQQMSERCAGCIERLKLRLGAAAVDLGSANPVRLPTVRLRGESGRLGPFDWWRLARDARTTTTVWAHRASAVVFSPGLLWGAGAPDGRDAEIGELAAATARLADLPGRPHPARWLGEQGPLQDDDAAAANTAHYWRALLAAADEGLDRGDSGEQAPTALPGVGSAMLRDPHHALNWQSSAACGRWCCG